MATALLHFMLTVLWSVVGLFMLVGIMKCNDGKLPMYVAIPLAVICGPLCWWAMFGGMIRSYMIRWR